MNKFLLTILLTLTISTGTFAQNRTVLNRHKFYDTTLTENQLQNRAKYKRRRLTVDVDLTGIALYAWGDECYLKINLLQRMLINANFYETGTHNNRPYLKYGNDNYRFRMYINNSGNFEFDAQIRNKSPNGRYAIPFNIQTKGLTFFYQPELTQEEIDAGHSRPDSVVNSYAVYHSTKRNDFIIINGEDTTYENYETGKVGHFYRPKVWDNAGDTVWGFINIDTVLNRMWIGADSTWMANAVHPITIDPEFGYTAEPSTSFLMSNSQNCRANIHVDFRYTASTGDVLVNYKFWGNSVGGTGVMRLGLYTIDDPLVPSDQIHTLDVNATSSTKELVTSGAFSQALVNGTSYVLALEGYPSGVTIYYDVLSGIRRLYCNGTPLQDPWLGSSNTSGASYGMYATYTTGGEPPTVKSQMIIISGS